MVTTVDHDVPSDPVAQAAERRAQAGREVEGCRAKVATIEAHLAAATTKDKQARQREHLAAAKAALASALAEQKGLD
jgi:hypothetical protein